MSMAGQDSNCHLSFDVGPELRLRIEAAAAERRVSVRDFVVEVLRHALDAPSGRDGSSGRANWSALSAPSFARDWQSDEDAIYDELA